MCRMQCAAARSAKKARAGGPDGWSAAQHLKRLGVVSDDFPSAQQQQSQQPASQPETPLASQRSQAGHLGAASVPQDGDQPHSDAAGSWDDFLDDLLAPTQPQHASQPRAAEQGPGVPCRTPGRDDDDDETDDDGCEDLLEVTMRRQPLPEPGSSMAAPVGSVPDDQAKASPPKASADVEVSGAAALSQRVHRRSAHSAPAPLRSCGAEAAAPVV